MSELVLAINRDELNGYGVIDLDLSEINGQNYAFLPREFADNKSHGAVALGYIMPQILGYFQFVNDEGQYFAYQRKGKEKGLFGQWSIGIGGHVSQEDLFDVHEHTDEDYTDIATLIYAGALRELQEEVGIDARWFSEFNSVDDFIEAVDRALVSNTTVTSSVHVGIPLTINISSFIDQMNLDPSEFCNFKWVTVEELQTNVDQYEDWSQMLIKTM